MTLLRLLTVLLVFIGCATAAPILPASHVSSSADVERVAKTKDGDNVKTTRQVKVRLRNMSTTETSVVGVECWMFYRDLATDEIKVQSQERSTWTLEPGKLGEVVAAKSLFNYTPMHFKRAGGRGLRMRFHKVPASGHKYYGYLVRVYEGGKVISELTSTYGFSSSASLPGLADKSSFAAPAAPKAKSKATSKKS